MWYRCMLRFFCYGFTRWQIMGKGDITENKREKMLAYLTNSLTYDIIHLTIRLNVK